MATRIYQKPGLDPGTWLYGQGGVVVLLAATERTDTFAIMEISSTGLVCKSLITVPPGENIPVAQLRALYPDTSLQIINPTLRCDLIPVPQ